LDLPEQLDQQVLKGRPGQLVQQVFKGLREQLVLV
jgi:hypothetical protein